MVVMETMSVPENKETLHAADSMLHPDTYRGQESVILLVLLGEFLTPRLLPGHQYRVLLPVCLQAMETQVHQSAFARVI